MEGFKKENRQPTADLSTVESQRNDLTAEEFPEGPYGTPVTVKPGKSSPWREDQRPQNTFVYENRELHAGLERDYPGDHPTHAEKPEPESK